MNTIDNNNAFTATYSKILNNLCVKESKSPKKETIKARKKTILYLCTWRNMINQY